MLREREHPERATLAVASALLVFAGLLVAVSRGYTPPFSAPPPWSLAIRVVVLAGLFVLAERAVLHVEFRGHAVSATLAGIPVVLGALTMRSDQLVLTRIIAAALLFAATRPPLIKVILNSACYCFEAAAVSTATSLVSGGAALDGVGLTVLLCSVLVVDQLIGRVILHVVVWHQGSISRQEAADAALLLALTSVFNTTSAVGTVLLLQGGVVGVAVLVLALAVSVSLYRSFQVLYRRHQSLQQVHDFVANKLDTSGSQTPTEAMLSDLRTHIQASRAELLINLPDGGTVHLSSVDGQSQQPGGFAVVSSDEPVVRSILEGDACALLTANSRRGEFRDWLMEHRATEAMLVPLPRDGISGLVAVFDRRGATGGFTSEDEAMLQTLAGHLAIALRNSELVDRLRFDATHDALTGLANRAVVEDAIARALERGDGGAVVALDLNRFKDVNDAFGHPAGDELLQVLADRVTRSLPAGSVVARLGGDEFAALVPLGIDRNSALDLTERLATVLVAPAELAEATVSIGASIGVALPTEDATATDLLRRADTAMYAAKESGTPVVLYSPELDRGRAERLSLQADLRLALQRDELTAVYQPKLDLVTDRVDSVEALVRWEHPRLGPLSPTAFVPMAEVNGLIRPLTRIILAKALRQAATWRAEGLDLAVAVNLSAVVVKDEALPDIISAALLTAGLPPSRLILEITESSVMDDPELAISVLERIAAIGVVISLDDFGTGYSSLAYLQRLPVSEVKIDRSFVMQLLDGSPKTARLLVESVINLSHGLGHRVVAEGAEDDTTIELLRDLGCDLVQGFGVSRPGSAAMVAAFARSRPRGSARILHIAT